MEDHSRGIVLMLVERFDHVEVDDEAHTASWGCSLHSTGALLLCKITKIMYSLASDLKTANHLTFLGR